MYKCPACGRLVNPHLSVYELDKMGLLGIDQDQAVKDMINLFRCNCGYIGGLEEYHP